MLFNSKIINGKTLRFVFVLSIIILLAGTKAFATETSDSVPSEDTVSQDLPNDDNSETSDDPQNENDSDAQNEEEEEESTPEDDSPLPSGDEDPTIDSDDNPEDINNPSEDQDPTEANPSLDAETPNNTEASTPAVKAAPVPTQESAAAPAPTKPTATVPETNTNTKTVSRVYGEDRYETAMNVALALKQELGIDKFDTIVIATGTGFADALSGSYLANTYNAPILLVSKATLNTLVSFIKQNISSTGRVFILGGTSAVPEKLDNKLANYKVERVAGVDRYQTNLKVLKKVGISGKDLAVCTGKNYPDAVSASALGLPILLMKDELLPAQKNYLAKTIGKDGRNTKIYVIGGKSVISNKAAAPLKEYGKLKRVNGDNRYETAIAVANQFFPNATETLMATGANYADSLTGSTLAHAKKCPILLTERSVNLVYAYNHIDENKNINHVTIIGGKNAVPNYAVPFKSNGNPYTGFIKAKNGLFYAEKDGSLRKAKFFTEDGKRYFASKNGVIPVSRPFGYKGKYYAASQDGSLLKNGWKKAGKLYYYIENYEVIQQSIQAKQVLDKVGYSLRDAYDWAADLTYFRFDSNYKWGVDWFAGYGFKNNKGNCYVMASTFYYMAKALGHKVKVVASSTYNGRFPHSWTEIKQDGKWWVYDPNYDNETSGTAYKVRYGDSGIWDYDVNKIKYMSQKPM